MITILELSTCVWSGFLMSVTVSQLMELPCLRRAKVLAGRGSLDRIVTSITVLEYSTPMKMIS